VEERQAIVDRFQGGQSDVFVGTIKAGGVGLTLTAANHVILLDRPWTPGDAEQAEDRLHRIGQGEMVNAIWLQHGAVDQAIDALLEAKQERIELVLRGKRKTLRGLSSPLELAKQLLEFL
jgi:SNF2 family DNA or RNA helicase